MGRESQGETVVGNEGDGLGRGERGGGDRLALPSPRHSGQRTVRWTPPKAVSVVGVVLGATGLADLFLLFVVLPG
ncbi:hypothetical protein ACF1AB_40890 [Streptomyces sp. NPDC014846]|uniref:hypothetical protein n=1 Tax=Streptomyces sp. NPDC014846 TaxID=3364922 RepID=UPI0036F8349B